MLLSGYINLRNALKQTWIIELSWVENWILRTLNTIFDIKNVGQSLTIILLNELDSAMNFAQADNFASINLAQDFYWLLRADLYFIG